jgi:hypothetical protein
MGNIIFLEYFRGGEIPDTPGDEVIARELALREPLSIQEEDSSSDYEPDDDSSSDYEPDDDSSSDYEPDDDSSSDYEPESDDEVIQLPHEKILGPNCYGMTATKNIFGELTGGYCYCVDGCIHSF